MLRHKALKAPADAYNPPGEQIVCLLIGHVKQRGKFRKLRPGEVWNIEIITAIGERKQIVFNKMRGILIGQSVL